MASCSDTFMKILISIGTYQFIKCSNSYISGSVSSIFSSRFFYRYWWGYLKLLKTMNMDGELLTAVLQLCDVELLFDDQHGMC